MSLALAGTLSAAPPLDAFVQRSGIATAELSTDGGHIVYVAETASGEEARVRDVLTGEERVVLDGGGDGRRLRWCNWAGSERVICGTSWLAQLRGTPHEQTGLVAVNADGKARRTLMREVADPVRDRVVDFVSTDPQVVLVEHDEDGDGFPEVSRLDTRTGAMRTVVRAHAPVRRWMSDGRGLVRLGIGYDNGTGSIFVRAAEGDEWNLLARHALADPGAWAPLTFGEDAADLYALKLHDGRYALYHVDLNLGGALSLMFGHPEFDVSGPALLDPRSHDLLAVRYVTDRSRQHFFDAAEQTLQRSVDAALPDRVNLIVDRDAAGSRALVWSYADVWPGSLHLLDVQSGRLTELGREYPLLEPAALGRTIALAYHARDGQLIPAYLTVPRDRVPQGLPAVLLPHGGPETRVEWGFDPLAQLLATRGYAVLQMNFRGSAGFGANFLGAGAGQWSGVIHQDITDGARWLARQAIADARRICIAGASFGGYAAMLGIVREPGTYRCAASYGGISDLAELVLGKARFQYAEVWRMRVGEDPVELVRSSPLSAAAQADAPVLLMHGALDVVVPDTQSRLMAQALEKAGKPYTLEILKECGHDLVTRDCRGRYFAELAQFLEAELGSRD